MRTPILLRFQSTFRLVCGFLILFTAAAASFSGFYEKWHFREAMPEYQTNLPSTGPKLGGVSLSLGVMLNGTASRPYVYRQLLPTIANSIDSVLPASVKEALYSFRTPSGKFLRERFFISPMARSHEYFVRYLIIYFSTFTFAILSTCGMFFFARSQGFNSTQSIAASAVMILLLPVFMSVGGYYYDYAELAFLVAAVLIALRLHWALLIPLAALAAWNKESFLLFVPCFYPLLRSRFSRWQAIVATGASGLAAGLVVAALRSHFAGNSGGSVEFHLAEQISYLLNPAKMIVPGDSTYGIISLPSLNPFTLAIILFLVWDGWSQLSLELRRFTGVAALINLPLFFLFCAPGELRDLSFLYLSFMLLIAVQLKKADQPNGGSLTHDLAHS